MKIRTLHIENYKCFKDFWLDLNVDYNIIVGDNETGKSTLLEAINLALTSQINGKYVSNELSPFMFNQECVTKYLSDINHGINICPYILIELFFIEEDDVIKMKGTNNSKREDACGIFIKIEFDDEFSALYKEYLNDLSKIKHIPMELFKISWYTFAYSNPRSHFINNNALFIENFYQRNQFEQDKILSEIISSSLDNETNVKLALSYRKLKDDFITTNNLESLNSELTECLSCSSPHDTRNVKLSIDITAKSSWDKILTIYQENVPFKFIGKGEQNRIKLLFAIEMKREKASIIMIEEPETNLSYTNMTQLIKAVIENCSKKQLLITTHSTYVMNKIGMNKVIMLSRSEKGIIGDSFENLQKDTYEYFQKMTGFDTLRFVISKKSILVEGPSDDLIIQKAYKNKYNRLPIEDGIDIIAVRGLSFKRFIEIATLLKKQSKMVIDNDGKHKKKRENYKNQYIEVFISEDDENKTLEPQLLKVNSVESLSKIIGVQKDTKEDLLTYMSDNKTDVALKIFMTDEKINFPDYINEAIE